MLDVKEVKRKSQPSSSSSGCISPGVLFSHRAKEALRHSKHICSRVASCTEGEEHAYRDRKKEEAFAAVAPAVVCNTCGKAAQFSS